MRYVVFGNTGVRVSVLGFGAMRLPMRADRVDREAALPLLRRGYDLGINYFDTAPYYCHNESEETLGEALADVRDRVYLSTKNPLEGEADNWRRLLEQSLARLRTDRIDFYHCWGLSWESFTAKVDKADGFLPLMARAREEGLIRHLSFSFHDKPANLIRLVETGLFASMLVQYNLLDQANAEGIALAHARGMGVAVMGPVGGGRLGPPAPAIQELIPGGVRSTAEAALRFVWANPGIDVALSGMSTMAQVEENAALADRDQPLTGEERERIAAMMEENRKLAELYCTGCNYCMPCPRGIDIPRIFGIYNYHRVYGLEQAAREMYRSLSPEDRWNKSAKADACAACGACEQRCPQHLPIAARLEEAHRIMG